jgi:hypothetical protein
MKHLCETFDCHFLYCQLQTTASEQSEAHSDVEIIVCNHFDHLAADIRAHRLRVRLGKDVPKQLDDLLANSQTGILVISPVLLCRLTLTRRAICG